MNQINAKKLPPIIIVGAHTMGLALLRAFKDLDLERILLSFDLDDMGLVSLYATKTYYSPHPETQLDEFVEFLINLASYYPGAVIFPASDPSLKAISKKKAILSEYYIVACPEWSIVELTIDKKITYEIAQKNGIPCPKTILPHSEFDVEQYSFTTEFPCLVKPTQSHLYFDRFRRKMAFVNNAAELMTAYRQAVEFNLEVVLQEYIPGSDLDGVNYNSYAINGLVGVDFTARKIRNAPPNLGSPCVAISSEIDEVNEPGRKIIKAIGFYGYSCTEFKKDPRDGIYKLMEVNGRHNLSGLLAVYCGLNFPILHYRHLVFGDVPSQTSYNEGRYWIDLTRDFAYYFPKLIKGKYSIIDFIKPYFTKHVDAIFNLRDIRPFLKRSKILIRYLLNSKTML
jgi:D-aspartate ligase